MNLFLYPQNDSSALWFANQLNKGYADDWVLISDEMIVNNGGIEVFITAEASDTFSISLPEITINSCAVEKCINTISSLPPNIVTNVHDHDKSYFEQEWHSVFLCLLTILKNKMTFNISCPYNFLGTVYLNEQVTKIAQQLRLNTANYLYESFEDNVVPHYFSPRVLFFDVIVFDDSCYTDERVLQHLPVYFQQELIKLLHCLDLRVMMVSLAFDDNKFHFYKLQHYIDYRVGGVRFADVVKAKILVGERLNA